MDIKGKLQLNHFWELEGSQEEFYIKNTYPSGWLGL